MQMPLYVMRDSYWSGSSLCLLLGLSLPFVFTKIVCLIKAKESDTKLVCVAILLMAVLSAPLIANYVYPFHAFYYADPDITDCDRAYVPHGLIHHLSKAEKERILGRD